MRIVAVLAGGGIGVARLQGQTMHAGIVAFGLLLVAGDAMDGLQPDIVVGMLFRDVGMATDAGIGFVGGRLELRFIHEK